MELRKTGKLLAAGMLSLILATGMFAPAAFAAAPEGGQAGLKAASASLTTAAANTTRDKASALKYGKACKGKLAGSRTSDMETHWYKFTTDDVDGMSYTLAISSGNSNQVKYTIYDASLKKVGSAASRSTRATTYKNLEKNARYYVAVQWSSGNANLGFEYELLLTKKLTDLAVANVKLERYSYVSDGTAKKPAATVVLGGKTLKKDVDYAVFYSNNYKKGIATVKISGKGDYQYTNKTVTFGIDLAANGMKASGKTVTLKASSGALAAKATISKANAFSVSGASGKVTYQKRSGNAKIAVSSAGKVTVAKGLKTGTYKVKVDVTAAGNASHAPVMKTVAFQVVVAG